jgi:hypothetical protein
VRWTRASALFAVVAVTAAACQAPPTSGAGYSDISAKARAALPESSSLEDVLRDNEGCYSIYMEEENFVRGLLDDSGAQVCD